MNVIYTITTCTKLEKDELGWPNLGDSRIVGWYSSLPEAELCVKENWGDIWETCYEYAIIEYVQEGLYPITQRWYYKWNPSTWKYEPIDEPNCIKHITNISIG